VNDHRNFMPGRLYDVHPAQPGVAILYRQVHSNNNLSTAYQLLFITHTVCK